MEMDVENTMEAQLYKDVSKGKHNSVEKLWRKNPAVLDGVTPRGNSALHIAARRGHFEMVKLLLDLKPDLIKKQNCKDETPLHTAAATGKQQIVEFLVGHEEVDVESSGTSGGSLSKLVNKDKETALHYAARGGHLDIVEILLSKVGGGTSGGSLSKLVNKDEETALHYAARGGHPDIVEILLSKVGGIETPRNKDGESALYMACDRGQHKVATRLLNLNVSDDAYYMRNDGGTCLHVAIATYQEELLQKRRGLAEKADASGNMPVHLATLHGLLRALQELLNIAPQSSFRSNNEKMCPIHIAAQQGNVKTIKILIKSAPHSVELQGKHHKNALHFALENDKNWEVTMYLLENMADVNLFINDRDDKGNTPLHMALKFTNFQVLNAMSRILRWKPNAGKRQIDGAIFKELHDQRKRIAADIFQKEFSSSVSSSNNATEISENDLKNDSAQTLSLIATLLATVSFAALFTIPGGVNSDSGIPVRMHVAALKGFIIADTLAMCLSMLALMVLLDTHFLPLTLKQVIAFFGFYGSIENSSKVYLQTRGLVIGHTFVSWAFGATMVSYATGLYVLVAPKCLWLAVTSCVTVLSIIFIWIFLSIRPILKLFWTRMWIMSTLSFYFTVPTLFRETW